MAAGGAVVARTRETYVCRSMDTECKLVTVAFRPGCIKFSVEEISDISASTCKMEFKLPPHFSSSEQFDASLIAVLNKSSFNTVYRRTQYQSPSWSFYLFSYTVDVRLLKCEKCQYVWCCFYTCVVRKQNYGAL